MPQTKMPLLPKNILTLRNNAKFGTQYVQEHAHTKSSSQLPKSKQTLTQKSNGIKK